MALCTYIDGIGASEALDTAGEIVDLAGLDCSSLEGATFNYEHNSAVPSQILGKILKVRKIFSDKDCQDERQLKYWNKYKIPYLYCMGRLFDDKKESSKEIAAVFRDDLENPAEKPILGFSIEGQKINKEGIRVTHSIARKVTITVSPANKTCDAEMIPSKEKSQKDDLDSIFKSEDSSSFITSTAGDVEFFTPVKSDLAKKEDPSVHASALGIKPVRKIGVSPKTINGTAKPAPKGQAGESSLPSKTNNPGTKLGVTKSGKDIFSHAKVHEYSNFSSQDHQEAAHMHHTAASSTKNSNVGEHHLNKMKLHLGAAKTAEKKENRFSVGLGQAKQGAIDHARLGKALDAGSGMAAPSQLTGGAALQKETIHKNKKKSWTVRATQEYDKWEKREEFRAFMKKSLPNLALGEIDAIGKTLCLKKSIQAEEALCKMANFEIAVLKFGSLQDQAAVAAALEERKKNPPEKPEPKKESSKH